MTGISFSKAWQAGMMGDRIGALVLAAATIAGLVTCGLLATPFLGALTWAAALAILFAPLQAKAEKILRSASLAAMASILIVMLVVALPTTFVVERLVEQAAASAILIQARLASGALPRFLESHPGIAPVGRWMQQQIDLPSIMASLASWLSNLGASFARGSLAQAIEVTLSFYLLFYFLRDRHRVRCLLQNWLPLTDAERESCF